MNGLECYYQANKSPDSCYAKRRGTYQYVFCFCDSMEKRKGSSAEDACALSGQASGVCQNMVRTVTIVERFA